MTRSEKFTAALCERAFLSLWTSRNPRGRKGKELCDALVVFDPHVIILSVKESELKGFDDRIAQERWLRRAVTKSVRQISGAERWLAANSQVVRSDGSEGLFLPKAPRFHRIAVAIGANRNLPVYSRDYGSGFVHVFDDQNLLEVLSTLDTISDFVEFITAVEAFASSGRRLHGAVEDLMAVYLQSDRAFPEENDVIVALPGLWEEFRRRDAFRRKRSADRASYAWDRLIEHLVESVNWKDSEPGASPSETELVLRTMAGENRFSRRVLGKILSTFMADSAIRSRLVRSLSGVTYVFLAVWGESNREHGRAELQVRSYVARGLSSEGSTVVGIGLVRDLGKTGFALDLVYLRIDEWTDDHQRKLTKIQEETNAFVAPRKSRVQEEEYPGE